MPATACYAHPDHIRVHDISVLAFDRAGDPDWYPALGAPFQPLKLYFSGGFTRERITSMHEWFIANGDESPLAEWVEHMDERDAEAAPPTRNRRRRPRRGAGAGHDHPHRHRATTWTSGREALLAHRTQVAADSFFFRVPLEVEQEIHPFEEFVLARSLVDTGVADGEYENDLFQGSGWWRAPDLEPAPRRRGP